MIAPSRRHGSGDRRARRRPAAAAGPGRRPAPVGPSTSRSPRPPARTGSRWPAGTGDPGAAAAATIARASGCSESALGGRGEREDVIGRPGSAGRATAVTVGSPLVRVPVLSNSTVSTVRMLSSASRSLTSTPPRAARSVAIETTSGIARPRACGQAITSTVIVRTTASSGMPSSGPDDRGEHAGAESEPEQPAAARSAIRCAREVEFCASVDQALDAGQGGVVADGGDLDPQPGVGGDGAGHHLVADGRGGRVGTRR